MKKIIIRICLCVVAVIIVAVSVIAYSVTHDPDIDVTKSFVTDTAGNSYLAVTGTDGDDKTYAAVTDENGSVFAAEIDENGNIGQTVALIDDINPSDLPQNYTGPLINDSVNPNDFTGNSVSEVTTAPDITSAANQSDPSSSSTPQEQSSSPSQGDTYLMEKYQKMFASGTYLIEFTTNDKDLGSTPITAAFKNGNFIIDTKIEDIKCKMLYLADKDTTYLVLDMFRKYCKLPESLMGDDLDMSELNMMSGFASDIPENITVSTIELNGKELTVESYVANDGSTLKYYFSGDTLVRLDSINTDGTTNSTYISRITSDVPDSLFQIPSNYGFFNLSWLDALGGLDEK